MALKTVGILMAYGPRVVFRAEGLGRYLAAFVGAATRRGDSKVVIATPSWSRRPLRELFEAEGIASTAYEFVGPSKPPIALALSQWLGRAKVRRRKGARLERLIKIAKMAMRPVDFLLRSIATAHDPVRPILAGLILLAGAIILSPLLLLAAVLILAIKVRRASAGRLASWLPRRAKRAVARLQAQISLNPRLLARRIYSEMMIQEAVLIVSAANKVDDVHSWYVPTALWPEFSAINRPRLICVPDAVIQEFPVGFSAYDGIRQSLHRVNDSINGGRHFVTYSEHIKTSVLVADRAVPPNAVHVVHHAPNSLSERLAVSGFATPEAASVSLARTLAALSLAQSSGPFVGPTYERADFTYIFYASQFRPSKNIATLLRAYEYLLRQRYFQHKLILTGHGRDPTVWGFIKKHGLERDVLCLHGLTEQQLAAFYKLAELAVNPSLSEGGMPFTYSEAISVGTPVVMGDIAVTREIITDPELAKDTLFDPYDWLAMANKIEWALNNKQALYAKQRKFYDEVLSKRTWDDVVQEHIAILDAIAEPAA